MIDSVNTLPTPRLVRHAEAVTAIDAEYLYPGHAAAHVLHAGARAAFVDVGTNDSVPFLLAGLRALGIAPEAVEYVLLTHVHLDHAGGAGRLMRALPNALCVVHPRAAPHMIDPARLIAGARAVYGTERFERLYGRIEPIAAERVHVTRDGERLSLGGRTVEVLHTPGHALHHQAFFDPVHRCVFTGDTFGISYRELDSAAGAFIVPTTTPTQFDPDQLCASVERLLALRPEAVYLMHYSRVTDVPRLGASLLRQIRDLERIARSAAAAADRAECIREALWTLWQAQAEAHGCPVERTRLRELLWGDIELNTQGLMHWLDTRAR
jgi:glyoxylase-like metal-dependent hydrolase (beta-lactamase superfamily II)